MRLPEAIIASSWRADAGRIEARGRRRARRGRRTRASSSGKPGLPRSCQAASGTIDIPRSAAARRISMAAASGVGDGSRGLPVVDMIEVRVRTRCRNSIASWSARSCRPSMRRRVRRRDAERIDQADGVGSHVDQGCRARRREPEEAKRAAERRRPVGHAGRVELARLADVAVVETDHVVPRAASSSQNASSQMIICAPSPMISRSGAASARRKCRTRCRCRWRGGSGRLMGVHGVFPWLLINAVSHGFRVRSRVRGTPPACRLTGTAQRCGMAERRARALALGGRR